MAISQTAARGGLRRAGVAVMVAMLVGGVCRVADAQANNNLFTNRAVGGVLIDPAGTVTNATVADLRELRQALADWLGSAPEAMARAAETRRISLRRLEETLRESMAAGENLPESVLYLGGLQQIHYVVVSPEHHDVVLIGPGEGWVTDAHGVVVGQTTGRPVMLLDDLVIALRSAFLPRPEVISCSIDPSPEGLQRLTAFTRKLRGMVNPQMTALGLEQQLGPQRVSVTGVPDSSHFARVMVSADYRMKRIGMNLEPAPVPGLPSFMHLISSTRGNMLPRWWLAPDYDPLLRDADGLAWQIRGASVKAMAESDFLDATGVKRGAKKADPATQRWADLMTQRYDDLAKADPVFGQLRNCMDLALVGALMAKEQLLDRAGLALPVLLGQEAGYPVMELNAPRQVPSRASMMRKRGGWLVATGGVQINPWEIVQQAESGEVPETIRSYAALENHGQWWAN